MRKLLVFLVFNSSLFGQSTAYYKYDGYDAKVTNSDVVASKCAPSSRPQGELDDWQQRLASELIQYNVRLKPWEKAGDGLRTNEMLIVLSDRVNGIQNYSGATWIGPVRENFQHFGTYILFDQYKLESLGPDFQIVYVTKDTPTTLAQNAKTAILFRFEPVPVMKLTEGKATADALSLLNATTADDVTKYYKDAFGRNPIQSEIDHYVKYTAGYRHLRTVLSKTDAGANWEIAVEFRKQKQREPTAAELKECKEIFWRYGGNLQVDSAKFPDGLNAIKVRISQYP